MSRKPAQSSTSDPASPPNNEIVESAVEELRSLLASVNRQRESYDTLNKELRSETRETLAQIPPQQHEAARNQIILNRQINGTAADFSAKLRKLKADADVLLDLASRIGNQRNLQIIAAYDTGVETYAARIRPICSDDDEAQSLARAASALQELHARMFAWSTFAPDEVDRATATAMAVLRELKEPIPSFS
jgi:hypothetical protein